MDILSAFFGLKTNDAHGRVTPEQDKSDFAGKCKGRATTRSTQRAFNKRVAKRRAKKGYK